MDTEDIKVLRPFGPTIAIAKMPEKLVKDLNDYTDSVINNEQKKKDLDWGKNLVGNVKQEFRVEEDLLKSSGFHDLLFKGVKKWMEVTENKNVTKFNILSSWVVRQFENEYNPIHFHNGHVSGVGYLKLPENFGETVQSDKKSNLNGHLSLIHGNRMFNSSSMFNIKPEEGDFYFFPNYMMHTVFPFYGPGERRSISFNANIDQEIYNVYG